MIVIKEDLPIIEHTKTQIIKICAVLLQLEAATITSMVKQHRLRVNGEIHLRKTMVRERDNNDEDNMLEEISILENHSVDDDDVNINGGGNLLADEGE